MPAAIGPGQIPPQGVALRQTGYNQGRQPALSVQGTPHSGKQAYVHPINAPGQRLNPGHTVNASAARKGSAPGRVPMPGIGLRPNNQRFIPGGE